MSRFKMIFSSKDADTKISSKAVNEVKLSWFVKELAKLTPHLDSDYQINITVDTKKIIKISLSQEDYMKSFNLWLDYKVKK